MRIIDIVAINADCFVVGGLESIGFRVVYELDYKKPILYVNDNVVLIKIVWGNWKPPVVPVSDTGTIQVQHRMRHTFPGAPGESAATAGRVQAIDAGCPMWFVNSRALGRSRDL